MKPTILQGDCLAVLRTFKPNSFDACVTDPPYHLTSGNLSVGWGDFKFPSSNGGPKGPTNRHGRGHKTGFMGKQWDGGDIAFTPELWAAVFRVLKPGAHLLAFGGTRTYHRMACAIEDAGFEIRDCIQWLYGSGFPKSHDVSKGIDRAAGAEREIVGQHRGGVKKGGQYGADGVPNKLTEEQRWHETTIAATAAARQWEGWGTALKPACELIVFARKPLSERTVAANVLKWGTGAINVDGCRVGTEKREYSGGFGRFNETAKAQGFRPYVKGTPSHTDQKFSAEGRWPANVIHDGSEEVVRAFPETKSGVLATYHSLGSKTKTIYGKFGHNERDQDFGGDSGSAARFFYCAKAPKTERCGSKHPTVKPVRLIRYLCRLIVPPGGKVLDPFAGSGTTAEAALAEGMKPTLIEREREYLRDINRRLSRRAA